MERAKTRRSACGESTRAYEITSPSGPEGPLGGDGASRAGEPTRVSAFSDRDVSVGGADLHGVVAVTRPAGAVLLDSRSRDRPLPPLACRRPDGSTALIVLSDTRMELTFTLGGLDARVSEWTMTSDGAYGVEGEPQDLDGPEGITITLPPQSMISVVLQ